MCSDICPYLSQTFTNKVTFISIEKQKLSNSVKSIWPYSAMFKNSVLVAPYPSYGQEILQFVNSFWCSMLITCAQQTNVCWYIKHIGFFWISRS
jgi:hypothetical protein